MGEDDPPQPPARTRRAPRAARGALLPRDRQPPLVDTGSQRAYAATVRLSHLPDKRFNRKHRQPAATSLLHVTLLSGSELGATLDALLPQAAQTR